MKMLKAAKIFLVLFLILILICTILRHSLCRLLLNYAVNKTTGLNLSIEELNLNILKSSLDLRGITLFNPADFKDKILGKAQDISIKYSPFELFKRRIHLRQVEANISEINIIRSEQGKSNVSAFKKLRDKEMPIAPAGPANSTPTEAKQKQTQDKKKTPYLLIDRMELSLKKVTYIDYQAGIGQPAVIIFTVENPLVFKEINNLTEVVDSVSAKGGFRFLLYKLLEMIPQDFLKTPTKNIQEKLDYVLPKNQ